MQLHNSFMHVYSAMCSSNFVTVLVFKVFAWTCTLHKAIVGSLFLHACTQLADPKVMQYECKDLSY